MNQKKWSLVSLILLVLVIGATYLFFHLSEIAPDDLVEIIGGGGIALFMTAMVFLPMTGFPITPFYVLGGASFGSAVFIAVTAFTLILNISFAYFIGRGLFSPLIERNAGALGGKSRNLWQKRHCWIYILLVRLGPGTANMKDYLLGALKAPFGLNILISWPVSMLYALGFIIMGDSAYRRNLVGIALGTALVALTAVAVYLLRFVMKSKGISFFPGGEV